MRLKVFLILLIICIYLPGFGQNTIYSETMGTSGINGTSINSHENNNRFNEDALTYSGSGDIRTTLTSVGYTNASGSVNVMLNNPGETFLMDGLDLTSYINNSLEFGLRKGRISENGSNLLVEYSTTGVSGPYFSLTFPNLPTGSGSATWYLITISGIPGDTTTLRFRSTSSVDWRIDDIILEGELISSSTVDWTNLQFPPTGNTNQCNEYLVYGRVEVAGVTNLTGSSPSPLIESWIGYSSSNTDPSTWPASNWVAASYNEFCSSCTPNQDEYVADLGPELSSSGTYYYASRFRYDGGPFTYGGYNAAGGGFWDGSNNISGSVVIVNEQPNFANVDYPLEGNVNLCEGLLVEAQVYEPEITEASGQGQGIQAWIGYIRQEWGIDRTYSPQEEGWNWVEATYDSDVGNNDQYVATIGTDLEPGTYFYASRFQINCNDFSYGGIISDGIGSFWGLDSAGQIPYSGTLTINDPGLADLVISEIMYSTDGVDDEWIEICNVSGSTQNLSFYKIQVDGTEVFNFPCGTSLSNNSCITVDLGDGDGSNYNPACPFLADYSSNLGTGTLPNSSATISLLSYDDTLIDAVTYNVADGGNNNDASLHLIDTALDNSDTSNNWFEVSFGGSPGSLDFVSPCAPMTPELDVERNTFASIGNNAPASPGNNTVFAETALGNSTSPKTFYIRNEGTSNLDVNAISSSNPEFVVVTNPAPINDLGFIPPNDFVLFEVLFSPAAPGIRTGIISINSNDSDSLFLLNLEGSGSCPNALNLSPLSGPSGTIVRINASNLTATTTANINGIIASVNYISSNEIDVTIPHGAETGNLNIQINANCQLSSPFIVIDNTISSCEGNGTPALSDLIISEVTDKGIGSHSYIELYNGTGNPVDLSNYEIRIHNNGATNATNVIPLSSILAQGGTYVLGIGGSNASDPEGGFIADQFSGVVGINEDDHIRLYYKDENSEVWIDLWGDTSGDAFTISSKDYTYRRKNSGISMPSTNWNPDDWIALSAVDYTDIGVFDFSRGEPPSVITQPLMPASSCTQTIALSVEGQEGFSGSAPISYQWYYNAPGDQEWFEVSDTSLYSNFTTGTLQILNTFELDGYQYYCQIRESDQDCFKASQAVKLNLKRSVWDGSNWQPATPDLSTIAVLSNDYTATNTTSFSSCQLFIENGQTLIIENNAHVEIEYDLFADGDVTIQTAGALVQNSEFAKVSGTGQMTVNKTTSLLETVNDYTYWSSPTHEPEIGTEALSNANPNRTFWFDARNFEDRLEEIDNTGVYISDSQDGIDDDGNVWTIAPLGSRMSPGLGYAATHAPAAYSGEGQYPYAFTGAFNTGNLSVDIFRNDTVTEDSNWNLMGNPYPSAISVEDFLIENTYELNTLDNAIEGALYIWSQVTPPSSSYSGNEQFNFSQDDYIIVNLGGSVVPVDFSFNGHIPSGQAFFLSMHNDAPVLEDLGNNIKRGVLRFNNSMRRTNNNDQFFRNSFNAAHNKIWVNLSGDHNLFSQTLISYIPGATESYDGSLYDTKRSFTSKPAQIFSIITDSDDKFAIQSKTVDDLNTSEVINLGFETTIDNPFLYHISIDRTEGTFMDAEAIYLIDSYTGTSHNLKSSDYSFTSDPGTYLDRFSMIFSEASLSQLDPKDTRVELYAISNRDGTISMKVSGFSPMEYLFLYDLLGRLVHQFNPNDFSFQLDLPQIKSGTFLAQAKLQDGTVLTRKFINY